MSTSSTNMENSEETVKEKGDQIANGASNEKNENETKENEKPRPRSRERYRTTAKVGLAKSSMEKPGDFKRAKLDEENACSGGELATASKIEDTSVAGGSVTPASENGGRIKSALVLSRQPNRPNKKVTWRDEEELTEIHDFELDPTERVNVCKEKKDDEAAKNLKAQADMAFKLFGGLKPLPKPRGGKNGR